MSWIPGKRRLKLVDYSHLQGISGHDFFGLTLHENNFL